MRKLFKIKHRISKVVCVVLFLIFFFTIILINYYNNHLNSRLIQVAKLKITKITERFLSQNVGYSMFKDIKLDDLLVINKNNDGEILYVDYNLNKAYQVLEIISTKLDILINDLENGKINSVSDKYIISNRYGLIMKLPMLISSKYAMFSNLGPSIYMNINFVGALLTNIKTKITDYGLNNALVELYVTIKINEEIISPVSNDNTEIEYDVLISSKVINGRVPLAYGGIIETKSNLLSIPIEK